MDGGKFYPREKGAAPTVLAEKERERDTPHVAAFYEAIRTGGKPPAGIEIGATAALTAILGRAMKSARLWLALLFLGALSWSYVATARAQRNIPPLRPLTTEEGQRVVFDRGNWQQRELAKRLPLEESWPTGADREAALARYGLDKNAPPEAIPVPSVIARDVYLVGQDRVSNLTYLLDCGPEGLALIDPTYESEFEHTLEKIEACGFNRKQVKWVLNTHCHMDHAMADRKFHDMGAKILVHEADAAAIEKATRVTGYYTTKFKFPACPVDRRLSDGEELQLGNKLLHVIHTPGHTPGSASFLLQVEGSNLLFSGDTAFFDGRLGWQGNPYADNRAYLASLQKLANFSLGNGPLRWDFLLPGHGAIPVDKAYLDVRKSVEWTAAELANGGEVLSSAYRLPLYRAKMFGRPAVAYRP
ncbi:MAG: MBL fold metallo-hydrolase [Acidobacteria bacterium]|nr:MBL fold metallo-hydrolase [Acidobacteriota bacterium]